MADLDIEIVTNIEGLDELEEAFTQGSRRAVKKFLRKVEMQAAKPLVESAKQYAPYDTGHLESDIHRESQVTEDALTVRVGPGKDTFYGQFQEFGAPEANVPALHWLENSARAVQDEVLEAYYDALNEGLEDMK
jgi:HK97 gp10 family phage protein